MIYLFMKTFFVKDARESMMLVLLLLLVVEGRGEGGKDSTSLLANVGCDGRDVLVYSNIQLKN